jgi:hypothetical protein
MTAFQLGLARGIAFTFALVAVMHAPASAAKFEKYYRVGSIGLAPLTVTSTGFSNGALCLTVVNGATQPVVEMTLSANFDDARVKPASVDIKRRIDPGMSSTFNCIPVGLSETTNVVIGRVEKVVLADGTVTVAPPWPTRQPPAPGIMTAADGTATIAPMPIDLSVCQAALGMYDMRTLFGGLDITYKNLADVAIQNVDFKLTLPSGVHTFSDVGPFAPGETITHRLRPTPPIGQGEVVSAIIPCQLTKIQLADGRAWTPAASR